jgi:hypothetical protein
LREDGQHSAVRNQKTLPLIALITLIFADEPETYRGFTRTIADKKAISGWQLVVLGN